MDAQVNRVSSPEATGGAGNVFEQHVDAVFLSQLLIGGIPPILIDSQIRQVHLQTEHLGWHTDDVLLITNDGSGNERKLAAQIKRSFSVSSKNEDCEQTFTDFWRDFQDTKRFNRDLDALVIITLRGTDVLLRHFVPLLDCARASIDASDFSRRLEAEGYLNKRSRNYASEIRMILARANDKEVSDDSFWRFLRVIHLLSYDLNTSTAQTEAWIITLLSHTTTVPDPVGAALATWRELLDLAGDGMSTARSFERGNLPDSLLNRHTSIGKVELRDIQTLKEHAATIFRGISGTIGGTYQIPRTALVTQVLENLEASRVVLVTGGAGSGKSVVAKSAFHILAGNHFSFAFRAEEFEAAHLDATLHNAQLEMGAEQLFGVLAAQDRKLLLVESLERLLEASVRESFADLLAQVKRDKSWRVIITCRDYSSDVVRTSFLEHAGLAYSMVPVPPLDDKELDAAVSELPQLARPTSNPRLRGLLHNPYLLDKAARMEWPKGQAVPEDERSFRQKFWREVVREDVDAAGGFPARRAQTFVDLAVRRAKALSLFVPCDDLDQGALERLRGRDLVVSPTMHLGAPAHDVLEDWAIIEWIDECFVKSERVPSAIAEYVAGYPAIRRALRMWLAEQLEHDPVLADEFVISTLNAVDIPPYFRDDTAVAILLSSQAGPFLERHRAILLRDDCAHLCRMIHLLRVACKTPAIWLRVQKNLPSAFLVPKGTAWRVILELVAQSLEELLPTHTALVVAMIEDWSGLVAWWSPYPDGSDDAARIAFATLAHVGGYHRADLRKRVLKVIAKIPRAEQDQFLTLIERGRLRNRDDDTAHEFAQLLLEGMLGGCACRDFPAEMIRLAETQFCLSDDDLRNRMEFGTSLDIEPMFGIAEHLNHDFFPASALRGPFSALLLHHPDQGVDFVIRFLNHAAKWYGEGKWPGFSLEPFFEARIRIPDRQEEIVQWANGRFWAMYRGASVAPYVLQSALMALESWLLGLAASDDPQLESWLLKCIQESNNVAITGAVAGVCIAHPEKAGRAGLAVLTCRDFFVMDRHRSLGQSSGSLSGLFPSLGVEQEFFDNERKQSAELAHRRQDLEVLSMKLQFGEHREAVWAILDAHRSALPDPADQSEDDKLWRLSLHRMDVRRFRPATGDEFALETDSTLEATSDGDGEPPTASRVYLIPGPPDEDIQDMLDHGEPQMQRQLDDLALFNWGIGAWTGEGKVDPDRWQERLTAARGRGSSGDELDQLARSAPGFVACVCVRDHWEELHPEDREWCIETVVSEIDRDCDDYDEMTSVQSNALDASRPAAFICARLIADLGADVLEGRLSAALAKAVTHPVHEVVDYAAEGIGRYLGIADRSWTLNCAGALAQKARLVSALEDAEEERLYDERRRFGDLEQSVSSEVRDLICNGRADVEAELAGIDLETWSGRAAATSIVTILAECSDEDIVRQFHRHLVKTIVPWWNQDQHNRRHSRDFKFEHDCMRRIAHFVLKLSSEEALRICEPLVEAADKEERHLSYFLKQLVISEDRANIDTPFWDLWQHFADRVVASNWARQLGSWNRDYVPDLLRTIFLGISWKKDVRHWDHLEDDTDRIGALFMNLPDCAAVLEAYTQYLSTIGGESLPGALVFVGKRLREGTAALMHLSSNAAFDLESVLRRFVYTQPHSVKANPNIRDAVLTILDCLIENGSSAAYRMRDDFVTPLGSTGS